MRINTFNDMLLHFFLVYPSQGRKVHLAEVVYRFDERDRKHERMQALCPIEIGGPVNRPVTAEEICARCWSAAIGLERLNPGFYREEDARRLQRRKVRYNDA